MSIFNDKALKGVAEAAAKIMAETSHGSTPKTPKEKSLAALAHPKDKITHKDVLVGRGVIKKEEVEQIDELSRDTLKSYAKKALKNVNDAYADHTRGSQSPDPHDRELAAGYLEKANKRVPSIYKAKDRLKDKSPLRFGEEVEQIDELSRNTLKSYARKALKNANDAYADHERGSQSPDPHDRELAKGYLEKAYKRVGSIYKAKDRLKDKSPVRFGEEVELDEAFPTVADAKKRMDAGKTATGSVTKTATGLVHKRDYKDDDADEAPKKSTGYGARQNYKRSTRVNESSSFTEMLELYNEHGLKVLAPIETEEMDIDGTTIEVMDADKVNGFVETIVEEPDNEQFTKELKDQEAAAAGKKPQPKVAAGRTTGVKVMPESVEQIDERELTKGEAKKKEDYVMGMKKKLSGFKQRYGERAKSVMYATATQMAKKD